MKDFLLLAYQASKIQSPNILYDLLFILLSCFYFLSLTFNKCFYDSRHFEVLICCRGVFQRNPSTTLISKIQKATDHPAIAKQSGRGKVSPLVAVFAHPAVVGFAGVITSIGRIRAVFVERNPQILSAVNADRSGQRHLVEGFATNRSEVLCAHQSTGSSCTTQVDVHSHWADVVLILEQSNLRQVRACVSGQ